LTDEVGTILIIGKNGQVSRSLYETLAAAGFHVAVIGRPDVDLSDPRSVNDAILAARPRIVINPAAHTAVDRTEDEPELAYAVNADGAEAAAKAAASVGVPIIHFSTDYVFDGSQHTPYLETDPVAPLGIYGQSKYAGEERVAAANPKHVILRTAWVFSPFGNNFVKTMLRLNQERPEIRVVDDQYGNPTFALDLAEVVAKLVPVIDIPSPDPKFFGTFHAVNRGDTTWFGFARAIIDGAADRGAGHAEVRPIGTKDYPTRARRPAYSVLSTDKLRTVYGIEVRPWQDALSSCLDRLIGPRHDEVIENLERATGKFA
jgi:dTDP-4-dehydrorhamnose reductase